MRMRSWLLVSSSMLVVALMLPASAAPNGDLLPLRFLQLKSSDDGSQGHLLIAQRLATEKQSSATVTLIETADGHRAELTFIFDPDAGSGMYKFVDLSTGWWTELEHDIGFSNLGAAEQHADSSAWSEEVQHRARQERAPSSYTLRTAEGISVTWVSPWQQPQEAERAKKEALAELATKLMEAKLPTSVLSEVATLSAFIRGDSEHHVSGVEPLVETLSLALQATDSLPSIPKAVVESTSLVSLPSAERPAAARRLLAKLE